MSEKIRERIYEFKRAIEDFDNKLKDIIIGITPHAEIQLKKKYPYVMPFLINDVIERLNKEDITLLDLKFIMCDINRIALETIRLLEEEENAKKNNHNWVKQKRKRSLHKPRGVYSFFIILQSNQAHS